MQTHGYVEVQGKALKVLYRERNSNSRSLKMRASGKPGKHLSDEEICLNENLELLSQLKNGEVITL
jgi:hypothetical protein